jgi:glycosyltransferase involved in cell wall biosynthesis
MTDTFREKRMEVVLFQRKRNGIFFSIEELFERIRIHLPSNKIIITKEMRFHSTGLFKRLYCCIDSFFSQGDINHITGDIHFVALFLAKRKTILTIHDLGFINKRKGVSRFVLEWLWVKLPSRRVAAITTVSETTKRELIRYSSIDSSKIRVIHNAVSPFFIRSSKAFNKKEPIILQVGVTPNKNINRLIEALRDLPVKLRILGSLSDDYITRMNKLDIDFTIYKNLTTIEVVKLYDSCDIVSFVSTEEGFGLPIIEANVTGRVVVTSNISSMPEVAADAAHLVDPFDVKSIRDGILKVITDDTYREQLIENGYKNSQRFNLSNVAAQYNKLYDELLLSHKPYGTYSEKK